jgi:hypothetical protein
LHGVATSFANLYPDRTKQYQKQAHDFEDWKNSTDCINQFLSQGGKRKSVLESNIIPERINEDVFKPRKSWEDWEDSVLKILTENKVHYESIANLLNRSRVSVKLRASRINTSKGRATPDDNHEAEHKKISSNIPTRTMGVVSENMVINQLAINGLDVCVPCKMNDRIDALIVKGNNFCKLQIKGAGYRKEKSYSAELSTHNKKIRKLYSADEIDFFLIYCFPWEDVYVIPRTATGDSLSIRLYPHRQKNNIGHLVTNITKIDLISYSKQ